MRRLVLAAMMIGAASGARAADLSDLPILRGGFTGQSAATRNWEGWYVGGQIDYSTANIDLSHATQSLTNYTLRNTVIQNTVANFGLFSAQHAQATGFGAFVGRNYQWDDIVYGIEANYNYINSLSTSASTSMARRIDNPGGQILPAGHTDRWDINLAGSAALQVKDVVTFRGRVGWATGDFLPYVFGGLAVGRMAVSRSAIVTATETDVSYNTDALGNQTEVDKVLCSNACAFGSVIEARGNNYTAGYTGGLGTEMMLFGNVFARVEWEYIKFLAVKDMPVTMNSVRTGIGYKF
jgi:outer membrane immunogenic protein